jgi:hypothetical protein
MGFVYNNTLLRIRSHNKHISMITCANLEEVAAPAQLSPSAANLA